MAKSGVVNIPTSFTLMTGMPRTWNTALTGAQHAKWNDADSPIKKFSLALALNSGKKAAQGNLAAGCHANSERIALVSYLEAILPPDHAFILSTWPDHQPPTPPSDFDTFTSTHMGRTEKVTTDAFWTDILNEAHTLAATPKFISAQFTFLLAIAKKGDMTNRFSRKSALAMVNELNLNDLDLFVDEVAWVANRFIRTCGYTTSAHWGTFFARIATASTDVERVRTIVGWAKHCGVTRMSMVVKAYTMFPTFDWKAVERAYSGQLMYAQRMFLRHHAEPFKAFTNPAVGDDWPATWFLDVATIAQMLLEATGDTNITAYAGTRSHNMAARASWRNTCIQFAQNLSTLATGVIDVSAKHNIRVDKINFQIPLTADDSCHEEEEGEGGESGDDDDESQIRI